MPYGLKELTSKFDNGTQHSIEQNREKQKETGDEKNLQLQILVIVGVLGQVIFAPPWIRVAVAPSRRRVGRASIDAACGEAAAVYCFR